MSDGSSEPHDRQQHLDELLAELMRAIDDGQSVSADYWIARHPDFVTELEEFFRQHERVEKLIRPLRRAAAHVLHVRCPHCHNPIELLDEAVLEEISCPSCGSSFSLVGAYTQSHFPPGANTLGHFELLDRVGIGQFGSVWKARDTKLDRTVAIKIPRNGRMDSVETEMFLRDARAASQLKHPNIVSVHEVGMQDDTLYIVSDFVQGVTLKEWTEAKRLTPREAAELCSKIARALHHAHQAGVIHRDLKPSNIMIDMDGEPHIVDFGLAKREKGEITMTVEGQILGTPTYMSPEQARGEAHIADCRADVYSLGVIFFELLTGELPFRGDKQMLIVQILKDDPPGPRQLDASLPRDLDMICLKCLEKEPFKRYLSAQVLGDELDRFCRGESIQTRPISWLDRIGKWARRRPAIAASAGAALVATIVTILSLSIAIMQVSERANTERASRLQTERETVRLLFERAYARCLDGETDQGLLSMAHTLEKAHAAGFGDLEASARRHLTAWSSLMFRLQMICGISDVERSSGVVAISPEGKWIVVGDTTFDVEQGTTAETPIKALSGRGNEGAAFSPDGKILATGNFKSTRLWDVPTWQPKRPLVEYGGVTMAFSPDQTSVLLFGVN